MNQDSVAIIHLVWRGAGPIALRRFADSYRRFRAGVNHRLVLVFKEIADADRDVYESIVADLPHLRVEMPAPCFDIPAYINVAQTLSETRVCLLNSNSEILADDWLAMLNAVAAAPEVGAAAATGSWESHLTSALDAYRNAAACGQHFPWDQMRKEVQNLAHFFSPFPNYHLRTNALVINRVRFLELPFRCDTGSKAECLVFESGWMGLTHQMVSRGLLPVVVGRDGNVYLKEQWPESRTFRSGAQENLLVGDNRTRDYLQANSQTRQILASMAWGPR
jgi:hypothetical protein